MGVATFFGVIEAILLTLFTIYVIHKGYEFVMEDDKTLRRVGFTYIFIGLLVMRFVNLSFNQMALISDNRSHFEQIESLKIQFRYLAAVTQPDKDYESD